MTKNTILLQRKLVNLASAEQIWHMDVNLQLAMSVNHELMTYGFMLSQEAFDMVKAADSADIIDFHKDVISYLKDIMGAGKYRSLYGNFPNDKMSMTDTEVYINQIIHYWTTKQFTTVGRPKDVAFEQVEYKIIEPCTEKEYKGIFTALLSVGNSITKADQDTIKWFVNNETGLTYPERIPFKENLAIIAELCPDFTVSTVVDVLRVAVGFSGGDVSLPAVPKLLKKKGRKYASRVEERNKFKFKLDEKQRERIYQLFESSNLDKRDMQQGSKYGRFIRLAEVIKPERNKDRYPKTFEAFNHLRNQKRKGKPDGMSVIRTWYSDVKTLFKKDFISGLTKLSERPGEFLRQLDHLVRNNPKELFHTLTTLARVGERSSNKVLFEVWNHFENRANPVTGRSIFIKGARKKTPLPDLPGLPKDTIDAIQSSILTCLQGKFSTLEPLGKCYIDEELKKIPLPTNMRSVSESLTVVIRGQRMPVPDGKVIRCYIHWMDKTGNTDLDLSATFVGKKSQTITFSNQNLGKSLHSGDVRHHRGACAEYIDIDIQDALSNGFKYVLFDVRDFDGGGLEDKKACFGFMTRSHPEASRTWLPSTIQNSGKLTTKATGVFICIFDLNTMEYIWVDQDNSKRTSHNMTDAMKIVKDYAELPKVSVYDLIRLHVEARGTVASKEFADTQFLFSDYSTSYVKTLELMGI